MLYPHVREEFHIHWDSIALSWQVSGERKTTIRKKLKSPVCDSRQASQAVNVHSEEVM